MDAVAAQRDILEIHQVFCRTTADTALLVRPRQNSIICDENLHRVVLVDTQGSAKLLWDYQSAEMINTANNSNSFHKKSPPFSSWGLALH
ncbi:hypothetical protein ANACOL_00144 [Anaerotruncus colihominis DSM 17241]|uniref:Uncharacterized protein n=1 Tax=Anaerotruncus colihominis DSM 17241 TaxID=445972 RepID=B0P5X1_9FIRM|nr:hypothetical protein ANACOL_00144 [Anaerotruncus colihominis DSM 17241]